MREFKFRAWSKARKMFIIDGMNIEEIQQDASKSLELPLIISQEECIWQQYTGLKDRDDKEIYEGDIVYCYFANRPEKENLGIIEFSEKYSHFGIRITRNSVYVAAMDVPKPFFNFITNESDLLVDIIGNIFQNPELVKS
jgi:uncharacterized phage protein (TIGR01671 family)